MLSFTLLSDIVAKKRIRSEEDSEGDGTWVREII